MAVKTISLNEEAYRRLRQARRYPGESFSDVVLRARWADDTTTGRERLARVRSRGPLLRDEELVRIESVTALDSPPQNKWAPD